MNPLNPWAVALIVLLGPADAELPTLSADEFEPGMQRVVPVEWVAFCDVVYLLDVDSRREGWYEDDFNWEVTRLRARHRELMESPPLADVQRLPSRAEAAAKCKFSEEHVAILRNLAAMHQGQDGRYARMLAEAQYAGYVWQYIRWAGDDLCHPSDRRLALRSLCACVGPAAYYAGDWPPPAPLWYFRDAP